MPIIDVKDLSFRFPHEDYVWQNLDFQIKRGSFTLLLGPNGVGKTALLKHFVYKMAPHGERSGQILYRGEDLFSLPDMDRVSKIAYVGQRADSQMLSESVWQELAFSLERIGMDPISMRLRIAEIANFFGIEDWFWDNTYTLSGGQKQIVNVASALVLRPELLILDEADGNLDPVMRSEFYAILRRLHAELGISILLCSHNWSYALPYASDVLYLEKDGITSYSSAKDFVHSQLKEKSPLQYALPVASQVMYTMHPSVSSENLALTLAEVKEQFAQNNVQTPLLLSERNASQDRSVDNSTNSSLKKDSLEEAHTPIVELKDLSFRYKRYGKEILSHLNLAIYPGEFFVLLGGNGSGKSTLLKCIMDGLKYHGKILWRGEKKKENLRLSYLPQNALLLFQKESILEELLALGLTESEAKEKLRSLHLYDARHKSPFDLSGGEVQRLALHILFMRKPEVLLLDEPSNNLSPEDKILLAKLLQDFVQGGGTIIAVSHNLPFTAENATRVALLFQGEIAANASPKRFFKNNYFYTTEARKMQDLIDPSGEACTIQKLLENIDLAKDRDML